MKAKVKELKLKFEKKKKSCLRHFGMSKPRFQSILSLHSI